jgi:two-component system OmpR family response regulator
MIEGMEAERTALVIEDDADIREVLEVTLISAGFAVHCAEDGRTGIEIARVTSPDLITLDLGLPGIDGVEVCRRLRDFSDAYIVMVTARYEEADRLVGLETGADDFLVKPFSPRELKARVNAMFRRPRRPVAAGSPSPGEPPAGRIDHEVLEHGALVVDVDGRRVRRGNEELELTRTEFDLLTELMRSPARVRSRESLLRSVWGDDWSTDTHLVEVHVANLRRKLGDGGAGGPIRTVRGVGYRMADPR